MNVNYNWHLFEFFFLFENLSKVKYKKGCFVRETEHKEYVRKMIIMNCLQSKLLQWDLKSRNV